MNAQAPSGDSENPKDKIGAAKVDLSLLPAAASIHGSHAMMDGAVKYGPYNWRTKKVKARIYVSAALRHLLCWLDGEEVAEDSGVHHLGHAIACAGILLDAQSTGNLVDDRPVKGSSPDVLKKLNETILKRQAQKEFETRAAASDAKVLHPHEFANVGDKVRINCGGMEGEVVHKTATVTAIDDGRWGQTPSKMRLRVKFDHEADNHWVFNESVLAVVAEPRKWQVGDIVSYTVDGKKTYVEITGFPGYYTHPNTSAKIRHLGGRVGWLRFESMTLEANWPSA